MPTLHFHEFELDLDAQELRHRGAQVRLERRPWGLLLMLVSSRGRLVSRNEIIATLWPKNVVIDFDSGLNTLVRKVRNALGDSPEEPRFIETVAGRGYRFIAPVTETDVASPVPAREPPVAQVTASGNVNDGLAPAAPRRDAFRSRWLTGIAVFAVVAAVAAVTWQADDGQLGELRIAVMPFDNLTGDEALGYMASGLAEEVSLSLSQIDLPGIVVIGGVSTRALANAALSIREIGKELDADFVVQSSLRRDQSRIRVTSRLVRTDDGGQAWTASFDRELTNVLGLQRELSVAIAEQVRQNLSPDVAAAIDRRQTRNPKAYQLYLKGRHEWSRFMPGSITQALQYYRQAVAEDPEYALAWAGIAHALITSPMTADARPVAVIGDARSYLQHALDNGLDFAETQLALASYHLFLGWDLPAAQTAARRGIELDPNNAMCHMVLGLVLSMQREDFEARAMLRRARELDPLFPLMFANSANVALVAGDAQAALEFSRQAIAINPEFWVGYYHQGNAWVALGDYERALTMYTEVQKLSANNSKATSARAWVLARMGRRQQARELLAELRARAQQEYVPPVAIAVIHAGLGDANSAFEWLDRALAERDVHLYGASLDPMLVSLHADARFEKFTRLPVLPVLPGP